jgi:sec-independent protein translocase protein TatA
MAGLGTPELLIIAFVILLLFGSKKLPEAARSIGRSMRIFKAETKGLREDDAPAPAIGRAPAIEPARPAAGPAVSPAERRDPS